MTFSLAEIAHGLLTARNHDDGALWANVVLMVDSFDFGDAIESTDGEVLLEALYDVSNGEEVSDDTVAVLRRLEGRADAIYPERA